MAPMSEENNSKLLARLKEGRERVKKARAEAKEKGLPDPKPRKSRKPTAVLADPAAAPANNDTVPPIDGAPRNAVNDVAAKPVDPSVSKSKPIHHAKNHFYLPFRNHFHILHERGICRCGHTQCTSSCNG